MAGHPDSAFWQAQGLAHGRPSRLGLLASSGSRSWQAIPTRPFGKLRVSLMAGHPDSAFRQAQGLAHGRPSRLGFSASSGSRSWQARQGRPSRMVPSKRSMSRGRLLNELLRLYPSTTKRPALRRIHGRSRAPGR
jgi:hypothetical protein